jgi:hypothetical protein
VLSFSLLFTRDTLRNQRILFSLLTNAKKKIIHSDKFEASRSNSQNSEQLSANFGVKKSMLVSLSLS